MSQYTLPNLSLQQKMYHEGKSQLSVHAGDLPFLGLPRGVRWEVSRGASSWGTLGTSTGLGVCADRSIIDGSHASHACSAANLDNL